MSDSPANPCFCVVLRRVFLVAWVEFLIFLAIGMAMGGTALSGKIEGAQHYLGSHGSYRPVSSLTFELMQGFEIFSGLLFISGLIAMILHNTRRLCRDLARNRLWPW